MFGKKKKGETVRKNLKAYERRKKEERIIGKWLMLQLLTTTIFVQEKFEWIKAKASRITLCLFIRDLGTSKEEQDAALDTNNVNNNQNNLIIQLANSDTATITSDMKAIRISHLCIISS